MFCFCLARLTSLNESNWILVFHYWLLIICEMRNENWLVWNSDLRQIPIPNNSKQEERFAEHAYNPWGNLFNGILDFLSLNSMHGLFVNKNRDLHCLLS